MSESKNRDRQHLTVKFSMRKTKDILKSRGLANSHRKNASGTPNSIKCLMHNCALFQNHTAKQLSGSLKMFKTQNSEGSEAQSKMPPPN